MSETLRQATDYMLVFCSAKELTSNQTPDKIRNVKAALHEPIHQQYVNTNIYINIKRHIYRSK